MDGGNSGATLMSNKASFERLVSRHGSSVVFHREDIGTPCPCRTPEGYRDPQWHKDNPAAPVCNEQGLLPTSVTNLPLKAFMQPVQGIRNPQIALNLFGEVFAGDHIGIFPVEWGGLEIDFEDWAASGEDYITYNGHRYIAIVWNKIPDPADGEPHHWEIGLRRLGVRLEVG